MKQKMLAFLLCLSLFFAGFSQCKTTLAAKESNVDAVSAVLIENNSGKILYDKQKDKELIPASITKIMTLLLIFDAIASGKIKLEDKVSVSEYASSMGGSQVFLEPGETQTVNTMIKCISIASANDAAVAMAEYVAGSEKAFVKKMNEKAKQLGMKHTHFKNCNGLDDSIKSRHYSSAYDVALMSRALISTYPQISRYSTVWMDKITHVTKKGNSTFGLTNTNKLVRTYKGITGLKTGSTSKAKYCLSATAKRDGVSLTAVVMAAPDPLSRFNQAASLLDYGFANCTGYVDKTSKLKIKPVPVLHSIQNQVPVEAKGNFAYTLCKGESSKKIQRKVVVKKDLSAPVAKGDTVGKIQYFLDGKKLSEIPVLAKQRVPEASYLDYMGVLAKKLLSVR